MGATSHSFKEGAVQLPEGKVHYYMAGSQGPPVVLLHGGGPDNALISWSRLLPVLAGSFRVYAPDWPKQGQSHPYHGKATQQELERCLASLLDTWEVSRAALVGLSMGGSVALGFALKHQERVTRLILAAPGGLQERVARQKLSYLALRMPLLPLLGRYLTRSRGFIRSYLRHVFKTEVLDLDAIVEAVQAEFRAKGSMFDDWLLDETTWQGNRTYHMPHLPRLSSTTLLLQGTADDMVSPELVLQAASLIPQAELCLLEGCGHWSHRERPEAFNAAVLRFLTPLLQDS
ncbi:alpha/beta hydrolase [Ktedonosporobacter rubrisoli]|uniref:Alpha/beta hydrolase n=1 Tax=Ktedonosporobacter rubrisoli TaxID=2509675 RepID=A0A4P6JW17_KTERU|nr:alpha/beta hydrolase [Ktedonosporobacter rubrisoli]QBD79867.1 alpha/beta hydrolase [Ktedonosporobacter rubrisoli]